VVGSGGTIGKNMDRGNLDDRKCACYGLNQFPKSSGAGSLISSVTV
jgi:hypothetical protein